MRGIRIIILVLILSVVLVGFNNIYWNLFRSDVQRTAMVTGSGSIDVPAVKWKYYTGGSLSARQLLVDDINNDGELEYVLISGGKVLAKLYNDILIWDTPYIAAQRLIAIKDINQDGIKDIVLNNSLGRIIILSSRDGSMEYINSDKDFNWIGAVYVMDIDGDGFDDIYAADTACGSSIREPAAVYGTGIAYSFKKGFDKAYKLFTLEPSSRDYYCGVNNLIADVDGDGIKEVIAPGDQYLYVYSTEDGRLKYASPFIGAFPWGSPNILTMDVDNDGASEIFLYSNSTYARGSRRITAFKIMDGFLTPIWQISPPEASFQRDSVSLMPEPIGDFDNNGDYEFITSLYDSNTAKWKTYVLNASYICNSVTKWDRFVNCYESKLELENMRFYGSSKIANDGKSQLLLYDYISQKYGLYELTDNNGELTLSLISQFPQGLSYVPYYDVFTGEKQNYADRLFLFDYQSDGKNEIIMRYGSNIEAYDVSDRTAKRIGLIEGIPGINFSFYRPVNYNKKTYFVGHLNDGTIAIYDDKFKALNDLDSDGIFDLKSGGFSADMLITDLEKDGRPEVFTTRSNGMISVLDGMTTDLVNPPRILWNRSSGLPSIGDMNNDGKFDLVFGEFEGNNLVVNVYDYKLNKIYSGIISNRSETDGFYRDIIFGNANGDVLPDIYYVYTDPYNNLAKYGILVWDGVSQYATKLWTNEYGLPYQGDGQGFRTVVDCNSDGLEDYVINPYRQLRVLNAKDGSVLSTNSNANVYAGVVSFFGGLLINHGGHTGANYSSPSAYDISTLNKVWESTVKTEYWGKYGSMVQTIAGNLRFFQTAVDSAHMYIYNIADGTLLFDKILGCGKIYDKVEDADNDKCNPQDLTSSIAIKDIDGSGRSAFIVGSKDGYLYAIDAETASLIWSMNFRYPISNIIAGDLDGDGRVEILISSQDGYIYAIDRAELSPTDFVYENDGTFIATFNDRPDKCPSDPEEDIDCQEFTNTLGANWGAVKDANGYEYAIISQNGTYITYWTDNGNKTSVITKDLRLVFDFMYYFLVRPYKIEKGNKITGPESISDGVKIVDITPPDINITLSNNPITPDNDGLYDYTDITLDIFDKTYITQWQLEILDKNGNTLFDTNPAFISVQSLTRTIRYDAMFNGKRLDGGDYTVRVYSTDIGGHLSTKEVIFTVCNEYEMVVEENGVRKCACPDRDKDGFQDYRCGGNDCDDFDKTKNPGAFEDCSTGDLNCDGKAIECRQDQKCIDGYCANPCVSGECAKGYTCENGYCIPQNPCIDVTCPEGTVCENGKCVDYCKNVICPDESYCYMGKCYVNRDVSSDTIQDEGQISDGDIADISVSDTTTGRDSGIVADIPIDTSVAESATDSGCSCSLIE
jgi:hypothetical protein